MKDVKKVLCWIFGATSVLYSLMSAQSVYGISRRYTMLGAHDLLLTFLFQVLVATLTAVAWWTILKDMPTARGWGIAASLTYVLIFLRPVILSLRSAWPHHVGALIIGVVGLLILWRDEQSGPAT